MTLRDARLEHPGLCGVLVKCANVCGEYAACFRFFGHQDDCAPLCSCTVNAQGTINEAF